MARSPPKPPGPISMSSYLDSPAERLQAFRVPSSMM
jgi:hypothetical protein